MVIYSINGTIYIYIVLMVPYIYIPPLITINGDILLLMVVFSSHNGLHNSYHPNTTKMDRCSGLSCDGIGSRTHFLCATLRNDDGDSLPISPHLFLPPGELT